MQILLLNPPFLLRFSREQRSPAVTKSGTLYYPMWLSYACALLEERGYECTLIDGVVPGGEERLAEYLKRSRPSLVVIATSTPSIENDLEWVRRLDVKFPDAFILAVGPHVSALGHEVLKLCPQLDGVALGEYELTTCELAGALARGKRPRSLVGAILRNGEKLTPAFGGGGRRPFLRNLDELPFATPVYKNHLNYTDYFYAHSKHPIVTILSARGCPNRCIYCVYPQTFTGHRYRTRSIDNICEEIAYIKRTFQPLSELMFEDDTFTIDEGRTQALCEEMVQRGLSMPFSANARVDIGYDTLKAMKAAGCRLMCVGIESGDQGVLDNIGKGTNLAQIERFFRDARRAGILIHGCFMVGNPGEDRNTLEKTMAFAMKLEPDTAQFFPVMSYPGTRLHKWALERGYITARSYSEWLNEEGGHNCVVSRPGLTSDDLVRFCDSARRRFYLAPSYLLRKLLQSCLQPQEALRTLKSARRFFWHLVKGR